MPTNKQRREAERRRLQRQLEQRRQREIARRRFTLVASVVGTLAVIVVVIIIVVAATGGDDSTPKKQAGASGAKTTPATTSAAPSSSAAPLPTAACAGPPKTATASFKGVTVGYATDLEHEPKVRSKASAAPASLECRDLVVGTGAAASTTSMVTVQYTGVLYKNGTQFDSSWGKSAPASFGLTPGSVIDGFSQGIGGAGKVAPMKIGGRRIIIMPASIAYGAAGRPPQIPANSALVFVVDLKKIAG